ncbi:unnamed protein product [Penicillium olsonii]|nr:unnamed protein product [Penicillium olsonii]CAG7922748.1 unnamed protein product [Penicillium olsonii]
MNQRPFAQGGFPLTLRTTFHLIGDLIYLQILYAISYLAQPFASSAHRELPPLNKTIHRKEVEISNIILGVVPLTAYSSATVTERQWRLSSGNNALNHGEPALVIPPCPEPVYTKKWSPIDYRGESSARNIQNENEFPLSRSNAIRRSGSSIYDAVQGIKSSTRGSLSSMASSAKAIFHQPGTSKPLAMIPRNLDGASFDDPCEKLQPKLHDEPAQPMPIRKRISRHPLFERPVQMSAAARLAEHFSDPGPSSSYGLKVEEAPEVAPIGSVDGADDDVETVHLSRSRKYHSIESYPGNFPVSDALDYSSLATAFAVRGRGTTSVRPFSDY